MIADLAAASIKAAVPHSDSCAPASGSGSQLDGNAAAGQHSAIFYTIIESCRARGLDHWAYLRDVLTRLPNMTNHQVKDVTPKAGAKALQRIRKAT